LLAPNRQSAIPPELLRVGTERVELDARIGGWVAERDIARRANSAKDLAPAAMPYDFLAWAPRVGEIARVVEAHWGFEQSPHLGGRTLGQPSLLTQISTNVIATSVSLPAITGIACGPEKSPLSVTVGLETSTFGNST
jgi:hypothetical protein